MPTTGTAFYAIAPTAFTSDGDLDPGVVSECVRMIGERGVKNILLTGSYGEFQTLNDDERVSVTATVVKDHPAVTVMAGAAALNAAGATALGRRLQEAGAHEVMVSPPFAAEMVTDDLRFHFSDIATRLERNLVVYNNPVFGQDLAPALLAEVIASEAYVGVKQGTKLLGAMMDTVARVQGGGHGYVLAAADLACAGAIGAGAAGVTSTNVWVFPEVFLALADPSVDSARKANLLWALRPYADIVRTLGQPRTVKVAMALRGYPIGPHVRRPYETIGDVDTKRVMDVLSHVDERLATVEKA